MPCACGKSSPTGAQGTAEQQEAARRGSTQGVGKPVSRRQASPPPTGASPSTSTSARTQSFASTAGSELERRAAAVRAARGVR